MKSSDVRTLIDATRTQLTVNAIGSNGIIRKIYLIPQSKWYEFYKPDDFGDHTPFVAAAGDVAFAKKQYLLWNAHTLDGIPMPKHRIPLPPLLEARNVDDFLHGLYVLWALTKDKFYLDQGVKTCEHIIRTLQRGSGFIASVGLPFAHFSLPEGFSPLKPVIEQPFFANASSNGSIAEKLIRFGADANKPELIDAGRRCLDAWLRTKTFRKLHLFPDRTRPFDEKRSQLMKTNSNLGFALIASAENGHELHAQAVEALLASIKTYYTLEQGFTNDLNTRTMRKGEPSLIATQAYGRLLLDASRLNKHHRTEAEMLAHWLSNAILTDWNPLAIEDDGEGDAAIFIMLADATFKLQKPLEGLFKDMHKFYLGNGLWKDYSKAGMQQTAHSKYLGGVLKYLLTYEAYLAKKDLSKTYWPILTQDR